MTEEIQILEKEIKDIKKQVNILLADYSQLLPLQEKHNKAIGLNAQKIYKEHQLKLLKLDKK
jgi:hypothetical protein